MKTAKVKTLWRIKYQDKGGRGGDVFEAPLEWAKEKEKKGKVEILEVIEPSSQPNIAEVNAKTGIELINQSEDPYTLLMWLKEEENSKQPRKTVVHAINARLKAFQEMEGGEGDGSAG